MTTAGNSRPIGSRRRLGAVLFALTVLVGGSALWFGSARLSRERESREAFPMVSGQLRVDGLIASIEIARDARGIPHVLAGNERDAWFGLGFAHAQDRLGQMVWLRRLAQGRTAEWIGDAGLPTDRLSRTLGLQRLAARQLSRLEPDVLSALEGYAAGVNARMARIRSGRVAPPLELSDAPRPRIEGDADPGAVDEAGATGGETAASWPAEPWTATDSVAVSKLLGWASGASHERAAVLSDLIERLGSMGARPFFPGGERELGLAVRPELPVPVEDLEVEEEGARPWHSLLESAALRGSAWAVPGRVTESGAPILIAEVSVAPTAPSLLYEAHVRGGGLDAAGITVPGMPVFWVGRNPDVAWSASPAPLVTVDLFKETLRYSERSPSDDGVSAEPGPPGATPKVLYKNGSRWIPLEERSEMLALGIHGALDGRVEELRVLSTRHGPIVSELLDGGAPREPLALAWTGALEGEGLTGLLRVSRARTARELLQALSLHHDPPLEVVYADRQGEVGLAVAGWLPRRSLPSGLVPVPGRLRGFDWRVAVDSGALPSVRIRPDAEADASSSPWMVATGAVANSELSGVTLEWLWRNGARSERVRKLVAEAAEAGPLDLRRAANLQRDVHANADPRMIPALLALAGSPPQLSPEAGEVADLLRRWNGVSSADSRGAAAFQLLLGHLLDELITESIGTALMDRYLALPGVEPSALVQSIVIGAANGGRTGGWTDPDLVGDAVRKSLRRTWMSLSYRLGHNRERWTWGRLQTLSFRPFSALDPAASPAGPRLGPFPMAGQVRSVARSEQDPQTFAVRRASTYRAAVDLASANRMLTMLAPGQSEHPGHPHFDDGVAPWREGGLALVATSPFLLEEAAVDRLVLEPIR